MLMRLVRTFLLLCVVYGCQTAPTDPVLNELRATPTSAIIGGQPVGLQVDLWRDFMPVIPGSVDGQPLAVVVRLPDQIATVRVEHIWVIFGDQIWSADTEHVPGAQDWVARGGPKWGPGVRVDVVAQLREAGGREVLVRAADRLIQRTD
jgi:hypothetical protein